MDLFEKNKKQNPLHTRGVSEYFWPHDNAETVENAHRSMPSRQVALMCNLSVTSNTIEEHCVHAYWEPSWASGKMEPKQEAESYVWILQGRITALCYTWI